jgi:hypothetical protein
LDYHADEDEDEDEDDGWLLVAFGTGIWHRHLAEVTVIRVFCDA